MERKIERKETMGRQNATRVTTPRTRRKFLKSMLRACTRPGSCRHARWLRTGKRRPSGTIALGVIGAGAQGQVRHAGLLEARGRPHPRDLRREQAEPRQRRPPRRGPTAKTSDVKLFSDFRELAAEASIDAVLMALPVHWHSIAALETILHGKHIYHKSQWACRSRNRNGSARR